MAIKDPSTYPLKIVDDIGRVAASKVWHGYTDLLVVVVKVDANILLKFLPASQRSVHRVLIENPTVEQAVFWDLLMRRNRAELARDSYLRLFLFRIQCKGKVEWTDLRYKVVAIDIDRGQH